MAKRSSLKKNFPEGDEYRIEKDIGSIKIGRSPYACDIVVSDAYVSSVHCIVNVYEEKKVKHKSGTEHNITVAVTDCSSNGTWIIRGKEREWQKIEKGKQKVINDNEIIVLSKRTGLKFLALPSPRLVKCHIHQQIKSAGEDKYTSSDTYLQNETRTESVASQSFINLKRKAKVLPGHSHSYDKKFCRSTDIDLKKGASSCDISTDNLKSFSCDIRPISESRCSSSLETNECCYCEQMIPVATHELHEAVCNGGKQRVEVKDENTLSPIEGNGAKRDKCMLYLNRSDVEEDVNKTLEDSSLRDVAYELKHQDKVDPSGSRTVSLPHEHEQRESAVVRRKESTERCTFCSKYFPLPDLVLHAQTCSEVNTKFAVESEPNSSDLSEYELCPFCREEFVIVELISHVQVCNMNHDIANSVKKDVKEKGEISIEHCPFCSEEFPDVKLLVDHVNACTKISKKKEVKNGSKKSLVEHSSVFPTFTDDKDGFSPSDLHSSSQQGLRYSDTALVTSLEGAEVDKSKGKEDVTECPLCGIILSVSVINKHFVLCDAQHSNNVEDLHCSSTIMKKEMSVVEHQIDIVKDLGNGVVEIKGRKAMGKHKFNSLIEENITLQCQDDVNEMEITMIEEEDFVKTSPLTRKESSQNSYGDCCEQCYFCLKMFPICELVEHANSCAEQGKTEKQDMEQCYFCLELFPINELVFHALKCNQRSADKVNNKGQSVNSQSFDNGEVLERCMYCFRDFPVSKLIVHTPTCDGDISGPRERFKRFLPSAHDLSAVSSLAVLNEIQQKALNYVIKRSAWDSYDVALELLSRVRTLGYRKEDLKKTLHWVRSAAPIIIHINVERTLRYLVSDTHYRNRFETGTSGGCMDKSARKGWESNIFNSVYDGCRPENRVKYGVLNIVGDPHGVRSCLCYGDSFLQLKKVRLRTTFASKDTSGVGVKLSCCEHYENVLFEYTDSELKAIIDVASGKVPFHRSDCISHYKEVQIHGPVSLSENVECIVVNSRHRGNKQIRRLLEQFIKQNKCNLIWMDHEQPFQ